MPAVQRPSEPAPGQFLAFIGLGGNLGDVSATLAAAPRALQALPMSRVVAWSPLYRTRPVEAQGPDFLNAVVVLRSALGPAELMRSLLRLELDHHRQRPSPNAPRTLDLDLLWFGGAVRDSSALQLPHPRMAQRAFVLEPLADVLQMLEASPWASDLRPTIPGDGERQKLAVAQGISLAGPFPEDFR